MFGKLMNNYYYGKSGKGDFRKEDMPENRWQLFWDTLRTRLSALVRINLLYMLIWLPTIAVLLMNFVNLVTNVNTIMSAQDGSLKTYVEEHAGEEGFEGYSDEQIAQMAELDVSGYVLTLVLRTVLFLFPCIAITGPATAGISYVTRNWARDEHAFLWTDFRDAMKENWKQALVISVITGLVPLLLCVGWRFYGSLAATQTFMIVPQMLILMLAIIWAISVTYMHPLEVSYDLKLKGLLRNGFLLGVARLPMSVGIRLLHCVPLLLGFALCYIWHPIYGALITAGYYILIGFALSRFITASYTNAVFDKYINSRIEGAAVNRGLRQETDDDDDDSDESEELPEGADRNSEIPGAESAEAYPPRIARNEENSEAYPPRIIRNEEGSEEGKEPEKQAE